MNSHKIPVVRTSKMQLTRRLIISMTVCGFVVSLCAKYYIAHVGGYINGIENSNSRNNYLNGKIHEHHRQMAAHDKLIIQYNKITVMEAAANISSFYYQPPQYGEQCIRRFPDVILVGVTKSGTRELVDFMNMHPNIVLKTPKYKINRHRFSELDKEGIISIMPCTFSNQIGLIKADSWFQNADKPSEIHSLSPQTRIMAILREPVSRILSQITFRGWKHNEENRNDTEFARVFLKDQLVIKTSSMLNASKYFLSLQRYLKYFPKDRIHIIESQQFKDNPSAVLSMVAKFLHLKPFDFSHHIVRNNRTGFHCLRVLEKPAIACYGTSRGRTTQTYKDKEVNKKSKILRDYYRPWNEKFFELNGERYDNWQI